MYKAESFHSFSVNNHIDLKTKVQYILELSNILDDLHEKGYSHRDLKIDNLLVLDNQLMLSDFGLIWNVSDTRMTKENERLGPYYIGPPELEVRDITIDDFRPSDVYLFAKVVWMVLKGDAIGFRGEYERANKQFYLDPLEQGIVTFEPVHQLLEKSTKFKMKERINIKQCRELLQNQLLIIDGDIPDKAKAYRFEEVKMEMINDENPDERIYRNFSTIFNILKKFISISKIIIKGSDDIINADIIKQWKADQSIIFKSSLNSGQTYSYLCYPEYIKYSNEKEEYIELQIKKVERRSIHADFISYRESMREKLESTNKNIFLDEPLVIRFEKRE